MEMLKSTLQYMKHAVSNNEKKTFEIQNVKNILMDLKIEFQNMLCINQFKIKEDIVLICESNSQQSIYSCHHKLKYNFIRNKAHDLWRQIMLDDVEMVEKYR